MPWGDRLGGAEGMLCTFLEHVDRDRIEPHVVLFADGPLVQYLHDLGIRTTVIRAGRMRQFHRSLLAVEKLRRLIAAERPDVILSWTTKSHVYAASAAILARRHRHMIWWQHGIPQREVLDVVAATLPAVAIGCSSYAVAAAQRRVTPVPRRILVIHPGIPSDTSDTASTVRADLGIPAQTSLLGLIGRVHPMKGQDVFLEAVAILRGEGRDVHALIVGGDAYDLAPEYTAGVKSRAADPALAEHVTLTGHVPSAAPFIRALDVLVCASAAEPFGIALLEGMRAGIPVVSTRVGGPSEIIENGVSGVLLDHRDPWSLAAGVRQLLDNPAGAAAMGEAGRQLVERRFTAEAMASEIEKALADVAAV